jgi:hypothetical protein
MTTGRDGILDFRFWIESRETRDFAKRSGEMEPQMSKEKVAQAVESSS